MLSPVSTGFERLSASRSNWRLLSTELFTALHLSTQLQYVADIGADLPGAVGADAPIDGRSMGAVHP